MTTWTVPATVLRIVDGDTFHAQLQLGWHLQHTPPKGVRVLGVDTPERNEPLRWRAATGFARELLPVGSTVTLLSHEIDDFGRTLATVTLADGRDYATVMRAAGHQK